jgi:hypothetical protein
LGMRAASSKCLRQCGRGVPRAPVRGALGPLSKIDWGGIPSEKIR